MAELRDTVIDTITGLKGVVIAKTNYLTGCTHLGVQQPLGKDGKVPDTYWVDETRCEVTKTGSRAKFEKTGGPGPNPPATGYRR